jgi:drug/metabolite transporter (DMT)-like permease
MGRLRPEQLAHVESTMSDAMTVPHAPRHSAPHRLALVLVWITPALWSSNYVIARAASGVVAPHTLALGRWSLAFALMLPFVWTESDSLAVAWRQQWRQMLVLGALGMWVCGAFVYIGAESTTATNIGLIYAATPVGIAIASRVLMHESTSPLQRTGMAMAFAGVVVVIAKGDPMTLLQVRFAIGDLWIVAAAASWVAYSVLQQYWPSTLGARQRLACITVGGLLVLLPFTLIENAVAATPPLTIKAFVLIGLAGTLPGFLSYQAYAVMLRELGATKAGVVMYLSPLYAAYTAWWFLGETPRWYHGVGAALILPSIYLATMASSRQDGART